MNAQNVVKCFQTIDKAPFQCQDLILLLENWKENSMKLEEITDTIKTTHQKGEGVYIHTFGCQMNVHDSQKILALLSSVGYVPVSNPQEASIILLNTCSVQQKPEQKVLSAVGRYRQFKQKNPHLIIGVGGCFARQEGENLFAKAPGLDLVFGPDNIPDLPEMIQKVRSVRGPVAETEFDAEGESRFLECFSSKDESGASALVTVMKGCNNYCSFWLK